METLRKNSVGCGLLILLGILPIPNVKDNIPILRLLDSSRRREQKQNIRILLDMMSAATRP
jgi:hypothetical protein